jgi:gluconolactonase
MPAALGRAAEHEHQPATRFRPGGAPTTYFTDPNVIGVDPLFNSYR